MEIRDRLVRALEDSDDPSLDAIRAMPMFDTSDDAVAVERFGQVGRGNVEMGLIGHIGDDEPETARMGFQPADHDVHAVGKAEAVAPDLDQIAGGDECFEMPAERGSILPRHAEHLQQLLNCRRMIRALPNERQHLVAGERAQGCVCAAAEIAWRARPAGVCAS